MPVPNKMLAPIADTSVSLEVEEIVEVALASPRPHLEGGWRRKKVDVLVPNVRGEAVPRNSSGYLGRCFRKQEPVLICGSSFSSMGALAVHGCRAHVRVPHFVGLMEAN